MKKTLLILAIIGFFATSCSNNFCPTYADNESTPQMKSEFQETELS